MGLRESPTPDRIGHESNQYKPTMRLIKYALGNFQAEGWLSAIALVIFFLVFVAIVWYAYSLSKPFTEKMARSPLEEDELEANQNI